MMANKATRLYPGFSVKPWNGTTTSLHLTSGSLADVGEVGGEGEHVRKLPL